MSFFVISPGIGLGRGLPSVTFEPGLISTTFDRNVEVAKFYRFCDNI